MHPFWNFILGDDQDKANATVHFPWGSTQAEAETAAHSVSPGEEGMLGPELKFCRSKCPSLKEHHVNSKTSKKKKTSKLHQREKKVFFFFKLVHIFISSDQSSKPCANYTWTMAAHMSLAVTLFSSESPKFGKTVTFTFWVSLAAIAKVTGGLSLAVLKNKVFNHIKINSHKLAIISVAGIIMDQ